MQVAGLKLIVFNVERGLCVYVRTPNNFGILIDCGCTAGEFSPAAWIAKHEAPILTPWRGHSLAHLIVTHPHDDHVEDIATIKAKLSPAILTRHKDHDWHTVLNPPDHDPSRNVGSFYAWQQGYSSPVRERPDYGVRLQKFALKPLEAAAVNPDSQHLLNNSSFVTVFTCQPSGQTSGWKVVIAGDNETAGWDMLLRQASFRAAVAGADFYVTAHHGHTSGFSEKLFQAMGKPLLNITSERAGDGSVFSYSPYARGVPFYGTFRSHLTTRRDGHITIRMTDNLRHTIIASNHE